MVALVTMGGCVAEERDHKHRLRHKHRCHP
jgi:hypothetical protein